ncbi:hypothetical protein [Aureivirga sp. CE67]|uniref:hypothetical protein n=1 Tax=Aureivirga sp. CE67 TaxID=1788983 RepID=UPI0018CA3120|nr:hypothetical protein [Aureivirga sp. CE67]
MEKYELVSFEELWKIINENYAEDDFLEVSGYPFGPSIDQLVRMFYEDQEFPFLNEETRDEELAKLLIGNQNLNEEESIYILIDKCYSLKKVFKVKANSFYEFVHEIYPRNFEELFFNSGDFILITEKEFKIAFLHHENLFASLG